MDRSEMTPDILKITNRNSYRTNLDAMALTKLSLKHGECHLTSDGALAVETGRHTGRSPKDKYIVRDMLTADSVWWENNGSMDVEAFNGLMTDVLEYVEKKELFVQDLLAGADPIYQIDVKVVTEFAWHSLFIRNLLIRPQNSAARLSAEPLTIIDVPGFKADPARHGCRSETVIAMDFTRKIVLICGTLYAGEMKKAVFTYLNFTLPEQGVMPMHCSANVGGNGDAAIFFGLSGTGKTTLSADHLRTLIGDDEHGWSPKGIFNFEGGCYAKTVRLSPTGEPEIYAAACKPGTVLENVVLDLETAKPDFDDVRLTENGRAGYPLDFIPNASKTGLAGQPKAVVLLTCDAFGVLPPVARLTPAQAVEQFLAGYTAKIAGTERGITEPQATFSACFGAPFMPRPPQVYGDLFFRLITEHQVPCWLINTGWTGGAYGEGQRMPLTATRAILAQVLAGSLNGLTFRKDSNFGFHVPVTVPGLSDRFLDPRSTWADTKAYDHQAQRLLTMFHDNKAKLDRLAAARAGDERFQTKRSNSR
jgi:phosphoenolpyruvate carboxykinase (ATP)